MFTIIISIALIILSSAGVYAQNARKNNLKGLKEKAEKMMSKLDSIANASEEKNQNKSSIKGQDGKVHFNGGMQSAADYGAATQNKHEDSQQSRSNAYNGDMSSYGNVINKHIPSGNIATKQINSQSDGNLAPRELRLFHILKLFGGQNNEDSVENLFKDFALPIVLKERYNAGEEWGTDWPAINYCWGYGVNADLKGIVKDYYGVHFNIIFRESARIGEISSVEMVSSSKDWYQDFLQEAKQAGFVEDSELSEQISSYYSKPSKVYTCAHPDDENASYQVIDCSVIAAD